MYVGQWEDDVPSGQGEMWYPDGSWFKGSFVLGAYHGEGEEGKPDGEFYLGQFLDGMRDGSGECHFASGDVFSGQWERGKPEGEGSLQRAGGRGGYWGQWKGGLPHGVCKKQGRRWGACLFTLSQCALLLHLYYRNKLEYYNGMPVTVVSVIFIFLTCAFFCICNALLFSYKTEFFNYGMPVTVVSCLLYFLLCALFLH